MKNVYSLLILVVLFLLSARVFAQSPDWLWASGIGGQGEDSGENMVVDTSGNHYIAGRFSGTINLGAHVLTSQHQNSCYIAKLAPTGNYLWAIDIGASSLTIGGIDLDGNSNLYLTGSFMGSLSLGTITISSHDSSTSSVYIAKLSAIGDWIWANSASGYYNDSANAIAVTSTGICYITGSYSGNLTMGNTTLQGYHNHLFFLAKANVQGQWEFLTGQRLYGNGTGSRGYTISINDNMDLYITSSVSGWLYDQYLPYGGLFIGKFSSTGSLLWSRNASVSPWADLISSASQLDQNGRLIITGSFRGTQLNFAGVTLTGDTDNYSTIYVAAMDESGSTLWVRTAGGLNSYDTSNGLCTDSYSNIYITGNYTSSASFGSSIITSNAERSSYIAKLIPSGDWMYAMSFDAGDPGSGYELTYYGTNLFLLGNYSGTMTIGDNTLSSAGAVDAFIAKLGYYPISASFETSPTIGGYPLEVFFSDTSHYGDSYISEWFWDFGDGATSTDQNPVHVYNNAGTYTVSLSVINFADSSDTHIATDLITVVNPQPELLVNFQEIVHFPPTSIGSTSQGLSLTLTNNGYNPLIIDNVFLGNALSAFHFSIVLPINMAYGEEMTINLSFSPLVLGANMDVLTINNNSVNRPNLEVTLSGLGVLVPLKSPQNLTLTMQDNSAHLDWEAVTENLNDEPVTPDYYFVWINGVSATGTPYCFLAPATDTQYTHLGVGLGAQHMFYKVTAVKFSRNYSSVLASGNDINMLIKPGMSDSEVMDIMHLEEARHFLDKND